MRCTSITPLSAPAVTHVSVPGSKSYTNRALILAALSDGPVRIAHPLFSDDITAMLGCLRELGIESNVGADFIEVKGGLSSVADTSYNLDAHLSGTTIRFILALSAVVPGVKTIHGQGRLNERPVGDLVDALRQLGAEIDYVEKEGFPPVRVRSGKLLPGKTVLRGSVSSQFLSAVLMIAPIVGDTSVEISGAQISKPYVDMTIDTMKKFGVRVDEENGSYKITGGQKYSARDYDVEGDVSSASYFFAIAALTGSRITVNNLNPESLQADMGFLKILEQMGNSVERGESAITVSGSGVKAVRVDMSDCPDQVQTVSALAAVAPGKTHITGVSSLRVKETERVAALERELAKMAIRTESTLDSITIYGGNPKPAVIDTYWDHRMAMAFAVLGTKLPGMQIRNPEVVSKTFPDFWDKLNAIGVQTESFERDPNLVLIGMRGSGKTTIARRLSKALGREYVDLDALVEKKAGKSIPEIVREHGWDYFRDLETAMVKEYSARDGAVISTGGGIVTRRENIEAIKRNGLCVYLQAPVSVLVNRITEDDAHRPALVKGASLQEEMEKLFEERKELYRAAADETITDNGDITPDDEVEEILSRLRERGIIKKLL